MVKRKRAEAQTKATTSDGWLSQDSKQSAAHQGTDDSQSEVVRLELPFEGKQIIYARKGPDDKPQLIYTHGAGGTIDSPGMTEFLKAFPTYVCFQGSMNMKARVKSFHAVIEHFNAFQVLGGRSMGARAAVVTALEMTANPEALVLVSYPLTAGGKQGQQRQPAQREQILLDLPAGIDVLFAIGSEDSQCSLELLREIVKGMKARVWLLELKGADHSTALKQKAGTQPVRAEIGKLATEWVKSRDDQKRYCAVAWNNPERRIFSQGWEVDAHSDGKSSKKQKKT